MLQELGYSILSTGGTGKHLKANGVDCEVVLKIQEGRPNIGDLVKNGDIAMMLITSTGMIRSALASYLWHSLWKLLHCHLCTVTCALSPVHCHLTAS